MAFRLRHTEQKDFTLSSLYALTILNVLDLGAALSVISRKPKDPSKQTVLFVKMDGIGDMVLWSTFFPEIDRLFPSEEYRRVLVGDTRWEGLVPTDAPFEERIFVDNRRFAIDLSYRYRILRHVRKTAADIAINCRMTRRYVWEDAVVRASGAARRIASCGIDNLMTPMQERRSNGWYTKLVPAPTSPVHEIDAHGAFLMGATGDDEVNPVFPARSAWNMGGGPIVFFLGAADPGKRWPSEKMAETVNLALSRFGKRVVLCGGPEQKQVAAEIVKRAGTAIESTVGRTTLTELRDILTSAAIVISGDTGAAHISTVAGVPTVVISPGNHLGRFFPYPEHIQRANGLMQRSVIHEMPCFGCGWHCTWTDIPSDAAKPCISRIVATDVIAVMEELMAALYPQKNETAAMLS